MEAWEKVFNEQAGLARDYVDDPDIVVARKETVAECIEADRQSRVDVQKVAGEIIKYFDTEYGLSGTGDKQEYKTLTRIITESGYRPSVGEKVCGFSVADQQLDDNLLYYESGCGQTFGYNLHDGISAHYCPNCGGRIVERKEGE